MKILTKEEAETILKKKKEHKEVEQTVERIIEDIKKYGDKALFDYIERFDKAKIQDIQVKDDEIEAAYKRVEEKYINAIKEAREKISSFQKKHLPSSIFLQKEGKLLATLFTPIEKVGIYIPAGRAPLVSTVIMTVTLAKIAGVEKIYVASPPSSNGMNPYIIVASKECGADTLYKMGGAHAIAAFAYGTESVERVDKIFGPGNLYVTFAKKKVWGDVGVDMLAGPTEIAIIADESASLKNIAKDLLCQLEHGEESEAILLCDERKILEKVSVYTKGKENCFGILVRCLDEAIEFVNSYAPEHLQLSIKEPFSILHKIKNAGCIYIGQVPVALGDYVAGPSHVLPTAGCARFLSPLTVLDFMKRSSLIYYTKEGIEKEVSLVKCLAELEGMSAHAENVEGR